jgi:hypothetical protein
VLILGIPNALENDGSVCCGGWKGGRLWLWAIIGDPNCGAFGMVGVYPVEVGVLYERTEEL